MTTIHADSPTHAVEQFVPLVLQSGMRLRWQGVIHYVRASIDVFVQFERTGGRYKVSEILVRQAA